MTYRLSVFYLPEFVEYNVRWVQKAANTLRHDVMNENIYIARKQPRIRHVYRRNGLNKYHMFLYTSTKNNSEGRDLFKTKSQIIGTGCIVGVVVY